MSHSYAICFYLIIIDTIITSYAYAYANHPNIVIMFSCTRYSSHRAVYISTTDMPMFSLNLYFVP
ncbi:hypothetical protein CPC08DRAFT_707459 [Agrocybe pediades]|nr:hypothetical protein CPC08DRAFT_707459 [Agrocybe pediades]